MISAAGVRRDIDGAIDGNEAAAAIGEDLGGAPGGPAGGSIRSAMIAADRIDMRGEALERFATVFELPPRLSAVSAG